MTIRVVPKVEFAALFLVIDL